MAAFCAFERALLEAFRSIRNGGCDHPRPAIGTMRTAYWQEFWRWSFRAEHDVHPVLGLNLSAVANVNADGHSRGRNCGVTPFRHLQSKLPIHSLTNISAELSGTRL